MSLKPLEGKHKVYRVTIDITETYEVFLDRDFINNIREYGGQHGGEDRMTIEEAVGEAIQDGWPGYDMPVSCWDDETKASNGTRSLGSDEATEVLSVDRCKTIEMKGGFPA